MKIALTTIEHIEQNMQTDDGVSLRSAAAHLNADWRNAVVVDGVWVKMIGWNAERTECDTRMIDSNGKIHKNTTEALRQFR